MNARDLIGSGTLEQYALGMLSPEECRAIEAEATRFPELRAEIDALQDALGQLAMAAPVPPRAEMKGTVLTAVEAFRQQRIRDKRPPVLHPASRISDYEAWLGDPNLVRPDDAGPMHVIPLDQRDGEGTAVLWLTIGAPEETHSDEIEKFLILEGTCDVIFGGIVHRLVPGSYLSVPLHVPHTIRITSEVPCKILLQRIAA
jgi:mannose-6-phosphate isomerase-like protein (cupin superfamily)